MRPPKGVAVRRTDSFAIIPGMADAPTHPTVHVSWDDQEADVDEDIAELVLECWRSGLRTVSSCQDWRSRRGRARMVWVQLPLSSAEAFLAIAAGRYTDEMDSLYNRILRDSEPELGWEEWRRDRFWHYAASPLDLAGPERLPEVVFDIGVGFPFEDLPEVVRRLRSSRAP